MENDFLFFRYLWFGLWTLGHQMFGTFTIMAFLRLCSRCTIGSLMVNKFSTVVTPFWMIKQNISSWMNNWTLHRIYLLLLFYLIFRKCFFVFPRDLLPSKPVLFGPVTIVASAPFSISFDIKSTTSFSPRDRNPAISSTLCFIKSKKISYNIRFRIDAMNNIDMTCAYFDYYIIHATNDHVK